MMIQDVELRRQYNKKELANLCQELDKNNVKFLLSNSRTEYIEELYKNFRIDIVKVARSINSNGKGRGKVDEVLIYNY